LPKKIGNWSLTSLQQRLVKTGGRLVKHARYYWLLLAEGQLTRERFGSMLRRIAVLPLPNGVANQDRQRIGRSEVIQWGEVSAAKLAGGENQTRPVSGTAKPAAIATQPRPWRSELDTKGWLAYGFAQRRS